MIVVKLGGSLYNTPELTSWIQRLIEHSKTIPVVVVPGGGPFADQVRRAQDKHHLTDSTSHHMAILAMKQFGLLLADIAPIQQDKSFSIWLPEDDLLSEPRLPHSWDISSDSIALWLASKLEAQQLLLIKHTKTHTASISQLMQDSIIDSGFAALFSQYSVDTKVVNYQSTISFDSIAQQESLYLT